MHKTCINSSQENGAGELGTKSHSWGPQALATAKRDRVSLRAFLLLGQPYLKAGPIPNSTWAIQIELDEIRKKGGEERQIERRRGRKEKNNDNQKLCGCGGVSGEDGSGKSWWVGWIHFKIRCGRYKSICTELKGWRQKNLQSSLASQSSQLVSSRSRERPCLKSITWRGAPLVKALVSKPDHLNETSGTYMVEENQPAKCVLWFPQAHRGPHVPVYTHVHPWSS